MQYDFLQDGHFAELKTTEMMRGRRLPANEMRDYIGKFYSVEYVRKHVLKQNEREIEDIDKQIKNEIDNVSYRHLVKIYHIPVKFIGENK